MSVFDFFSKFKKQKTSTMDKLSSRYVVERGGYWIPFGRPERNYIITDMKKKHTFKLDIVYDVFNTTDLPSAEAKYHGFEDDYYRVTATVSSEDFGENSSFSFSKEVRQKDFKKDVIGVQDVDLALYNELKKTRRDVSDPKKQEEAYLLSTLLRVAHDNIWIAPLLKHKHDEKSAAELQKIEEGIVKMKQRAEEHESRYESKNLSAKKKMSANKVEQNKSRYIRSLMERNFVDGI